MKRPFFIGTMVFFSATIFSWAGDWPQWRGPNRDGKSSDTGLLQEWPAGGPHLYAMGDQTDANYLMCLSADGGKVVWSTKVGKAGKCGPPGYDFAGPRC